MNKYSMIAGLALLSTLSTVPAANAASVPPAAVQYSTVFEDVGFVSGYDAFSKKLNLSAGDYRLTLTDFDFGDEFAKMGVMLSTATERLYAVTKPADTTADSSEGLWQQSIDLTLSAGQYYLSFYGKSGGQLSFYGVSLDEKNNVPAPVPVPAAFLLFGSGFLALAGMARRRA